MVMRRLLSGLFLMCVTVAANAVPLTLEKALSLANNNDPSLRYLEEKAEALVENATADGQWPDPKLSLSLKNVPVNDFNSTREGMTQMVLGASQAFPRGHTLRYKSHKTSVLASSVSAHHADQKRKIHLSVRENWLDLYYWQQAAQTVKKSENLLQKVLSATETLYSAGRQNSQDIIGAELELSLIQDKILNIKRQTEIAQSKLSKWIGIPATKVIVNNIFPNLPVLKPLKQIETDLVKHPHIQRADRLIAAGDYGVQIAREQYKPGFSVGLNYGKRNGRFANGDERPDFVSAMLTLDMPLFTAKRQDKRLASRLHDKAATQHKRDDDLRNLKTLLDQNHADWIRFGQRVVHYESTISSQAEENFEASLRAYQEGLTDFSSLIRAQVMVLNTKLKWIKLKTEHAKAHARLLYLQGEE